MRQATPAARRNRRQLIRRDGLEGLSFFRWLSEFLPRVPYTEYFHFLGLELPEGASMTWNLILKQRATVRNTLKQETEGNVYRKRAACTPRLLKL